MAERRALFAGSFDPFTRGHEAIVNSALRLFDRVIIGVGCNISKRGLLDEEQRRAIIEDLYAEEPRVEVVVYDSLTTELAREVGAVALVRGVRGTIDLESERVLEAVNRGLYPELQTVMLFTPAELSHISSSCVRELLSFGHGVEDLMPRGVNIENYIK